MPERTLRAILKELNELLDSEEDLDFEERDALRDAAGGIMTALAREEPEEGELAGLRARIERFECSHPVLTETIRRLVDQLSDMGI